MTAPTASPPNRVAAAATYTIPFALVFGVALDEGGFAAKSFELVGLGAAWIMLLVLIAGVWRPRLPGGWETVTALGALLALSGWTALSLLWSESAGRSAVELARLATYGSILVLALALAGTAREAPRRILTGVAAAIAAVVVVALYTRVDPGVFGENQLAIDLPGGAYRLAFPLGYWNGLAALATIALPLVLWLASSDRREAVRVAAGGALPLLPLVIYLTYSRTGVIAGFAAVALFWALYPVRTALLPGLGSLALGGGILVAFASTLDSMLKAMEDSAAHSEGIQLALAVLVVCGLSAAAHLAVSRGLRSGRIPPFRRLPRRTARIGAGVLCGLVLAAAAVAVGSGEAKDAFDRFRDPGVLEGTDARLTAVGGNGRWQMWELAVEAGGDEPLLGMGPGTYEFLWQRESELSQFVSEAHSLYLEFFGELGIFGFLLILAFVGSAVLPPAAGAVRNASEAPRAALLAAAGSAGAIFALTAAVDWVWEMSVIPIAFLFIAAAGLWELRARDAARAPGAGGRIALGAALAAAVAVIALPLLSQDALERSEDLREQGRLVAALDAAEEAQKLQPWAASPRLEQALIYESAGLIPDAEAAIAEAIEREETNWVHPYVLARLRETAGDLEGAREAIAEALRLNRFSDPVEERVAEIRRALRRERQGRAKDR